MQIQNRARMPPAQGRTLRRKNLIHPHNPFEYRTKAIFHHHADLHIRAVRLQQRQGRGRQHAVAQGTQTDHRDPRAGRQPLQQIGHARLFFDASLVDQHYGDVVANRIHPLALDAFQAVFVLLQLQLRLSQWTDQDFQHVFTNGHSNRLV